VCFVPGAAVSEHGPVVPPRMDVTEHLGLVVTGEVSKSSPGSWSLAPSCDLGRVDGCAEASIAIGKSMPVSTLVVRAGLVSSAISVEVGVLGVGTSMVAPSSSELVGSGKSLGDEVGVEFFLFLDFVGSSDGSDQSKLCEQFCAALSSLLGGSKVRLPLPPSAFERRV